MRSFGIVLVLMTLGLGNADAQKFGYINSEFLLSKMPEYQNAQEEIDRLTVAWQKDLAEMQGQVNRLYMVYQSELVLLTDEMKEERMSEIEQKEKELREYQQKVFGFEGLFFLKKQELIKPLQDKLYEAIDRVAKIHDLDIIYDKGADAALIYTNPDHDYSDFVLEELGLGDPNDQIR